MSDPLPLGLRQALESGQCVLFVGAGIGGHLHDPDGKSLRGIPRRTADLQNRFAPRPLRHSVKDQTN